MSSSVFRAALILTFGAALGAGTVGLLPGVFGRDCAAATVPAASLATVVASARQAVDAHTIEPSAAPTARGALVPTTYNPSVSLAPLVEELGPAVVYIKVAQKVDTSAVPPMMMPFLDPEQLEQFRTREGLGTGFFISADGYLLTNNHVVSGADEVTVTLTDERVFEARVIGTDENTDIALVKVDTDVALPFVQLGSSDATRVGDRVVAIGNPFGLSHTVTEGIVSAKGRVIGAGPYDDFLQTDASINPGNSGGPLFNLRGEVIGINTAINPRGQGIGFSVPIDMVKPLIEDLKDDGHVSRGWLGVGLRDLEPALAEQLGIGDQRGAIVGQVYPGTPAAEAGLRAGDVVTGIDNQSLPNNEALIRAVGNHRPGEKVSLNVWRDGKSLSLDVALGERPSRERLERGDIRGTPSQKSESLLRQSGVQVVAKGRQITVAAVAGPAASVLQEGDVLVRVGGQAVSSVADLDRSIASVRGDSVLLVIRRDGAEMLVELPLKR